MSDSNVWWNLEDFIKATEFELLRVSLPTKHRLHHIHTGKFSHLKIS